MNKVATSLLIPSFCVLLSLSASSVAAEESSEINALRNEISQLRSKSQKLEKQLEDFEKRLGTPSAGDVKEGTALDKALSDAKSRSSVSPAESEKSQTSSDTAVAKSGGVSPKRPSDYASLQLPGAKARLTDLSFVPLVAAGTTSANEEELSELQAGGHDPKRRGFTLQQAEISVGGVVDPFFRVESHFVFLEGEGVETEEAFIATTSLPYGLELKGGVHLTEFGLLNPTHAHAWDWIDQPVINGRLFGGDGQRAPGARISALLPLPWSSELTLGMQEARGETMVSFRGGELSGAHAHAEEAVGDEHAHGKAVNSSLSHEVEDGVVEEEHNGTSEDAHEEDVALEDAHEEEEHADELDMSAIGLRPAGEFDTTSFNDFVYLARLDNFFELTEETGLKLGFSGLYGPNATGKDAETYIYGADVLVKWVPENNFRGYPFVKWQSEVMGRSYDADPVLADDGDLLLGEDTLRDWGFYSQLLYGFSPGWAAGTRVEWAGGSTESVGGRDSDPTRADRLRLSPLLAYKPSEFSRIRLQYNYDQSDALVDDNEHSVWLGFDMLIGTHPAHKYGQ